MTGVIPGTVVCSVFKYVNKKSVNIAADDHAPVVPKLGDKLKIILGDVDKGQTGELLSIGPYKEIHEGVVKLDCSGEGT